MMKKAYLVTLSALLCSWNPCHGGVCESEEEWESHPMLCGSITEKAADPVRLSAELHDFAKENGWIVDLRHHQDIAATTKQQRSLHGTPSFSTASVPIVLAHGMGDSCFNDGMKHVTSLMTEWTGVYAVCIPTGRSQSDDTNNGFFLNMNDSVEAFKEAIQNNTALQNGFHAMGFSQGNNVIRGYITKYNDPPVRTFLSVNGVNAGTSRVPDCFGTSRWCHFLAESASRSAYTIFAQEHSFQANYWRDPEQYDKYLEYSQLAVWNNEVEKKNSQWNANWAKTQRFVWVKASDDEMVYPAESEHWGQPMGDTGVIEMKDTNWYKEDWFGLKTADDAGKNRFEIFQGNHLQFSLDDLQRWVTENFD